MPVISPVPPPPRRPEAAPGPGPRAAAAAPPPSVPRSAPALPARPDAALQAALDAAARRWGLSSAGIVLVEPTTNRLAMRHAQVPFPAASVIKLPLLAAVQEAVEAGRLDPEAPVAIRATNVTGTWSPPGDGRPLLRAGMRTTLDTLQDLMITRSDNVATNTLMDGLDRAALAAGLSRWGAPQTVLARKLSAGNVVRDEAGPGGRNRTTALDMATMLVRLQAGTLVSPEASARMKALLGRQLDRDKIPAGLPRDARVFHKTGETSEVTHDVAVIEVAGRSYVLAVLTREPPGGTTWARIAGLTRDLHRAVLASSATPAHPQGPPPPLPALPPEGPGLLALRLWRRVVAVASRGGARELA
ncbi:MAG: serine hydrolase [Candidatus Sericytochromatia bacterium]|nr:serine hydrolase [Candidatus Sericytochromatia bacterium]